MRQTVGMSPRTRWLMLIVIAVLVLGAAAGYAFQAFQRYQDRTTGASAAEVTDFLDATQRIVFRNTASGSGYGKIATVAVDDPAGPRELSELVCDRVDSNGQTLSCLRTLRGIPTTFETRVVDTSNDSQTTHPLAGIPSRTRVSEGGMVATTAFVTGHSYAADSFSTETMIRSAGGTDYGNLEFYRMMVEGKELTAIDRNVWGVTFVNDDQFYATVASGGRTWLVKGSISSRLMTSVRQNAECPSLSPDGSKVAYKKRKAKPGPVHWDIAVLDLKSMQETVIPLEHGFDDQLEWLDEVTLLFGSPRTDTPGDSDVYSVRATADAEPELLIEHAWSPSVVRSAD